MILNIRHGGFLNCVIFAVVCTSFFGGVSCLWLVETIVMSKVLKILANKYNLYTTY